MTPYRTPEHRIWPGVLDNIPAEFEPYHDEPAFRMQDMTFAVWRTEKDSEWQIGEVEFPTDEIVEDNDPDGFIQLLELMDGQARDYQFFAEEYYEETIPLSAIEHIYQHKPLTNAIIKNLKPNLSLSDIKDDIIEIGYPTAH